MLWQAGARVSEAIILVPERIGLSSVVLRNLKQKKIVKDENGKTVRDENGKPLRELDIMAVKEVEVSEDLCTRLKQYCKDMSIKPGDYVFQANRSSNHLSRWYVWDMLTKAAEIAQVFRFGKRNPKTGGRFKGPGPHMLRHSSAMHMLEETEDIMLVKQQLGHSSVITTQGYAFVKARKIKKAIKNIKW